jgi:hypothetical protein
MLYEHPAFSWDFDSDVRIKQIRDLSVAENELDTCMEELAEDMKVVSTLYRQLKA